MYADIIAIGMAFLLGLGARLTGLPPLVGYLIAGFVLYGAGMEASATLRGFSDIGITLLLFSIGLKLRVGNLLMPQVWAVASLHMLAAVLLLTAGILGLGWIGTPVLAGLDARQVVLIAFVLSFSSTVFAVKVLEEKGEIDAMYGRIAIGILIIQDIAAVIFLAVSSGKLPTLWALLLLLLIPLRPLLLKTLDRSGHGELLILFGLSLALGGASVFELVGIKGDLGALVMGAALAGHQKAKELSRNLLQFKDLFLVGFFLSIGLDGWPSSQIIVLSVVLGALALLKPLLYFPLFTLFHTPPRTALLASATLANFSEFGLIVIALAASSGWVDPQWSAAMSLVIAVSFLLASPLNKGSHSFYSKFRSQLQRFESSAVKASHPNTSDVRVIVLGMGNIGTGAYESIATQYGPQVLGVDDNDTKLARHKSQHRRVVAADASDPDFWHRVDLSEVELVMLALTNHQENMLVAKLLKQIGYPGKTVAVVRFREEAEELEKMGISAFNLYAQAGAGFAAHANETTPTTAWTSE